MAFMHIVSITENTRVVQFGTGQPTTIGYDISLELVDDYGGTIRLDTELTRDEITELNKLAEKIYKRFVDRKILHDPRTDM